ncbi:MAG TPA: porin [Solimonas sp.]|nr:porin [Solimonas sp.]
MKTTGLTGLVITGSVLLASTQVLAQDESATVESLDQRIRILERQLELQKEEAETKAKDATTASAGDRGYALKKGDFELKIKGLIQADGRFFLDDQAPRVNDTFTLRRLRPTFEGSLGKLVGFRLTPEFAGDGATIVDAYVDLKFDPAATVRAGKVKGPVGLERLQSGAATTFIERGYPTELAPNRDIGVQLQGDLFGSTLNYTLGYYNGTADGRDAASRDVDNRKEIGARLFAEPFKNSPGVLQGLGFGIGGTHGSKFSNAVGTNGALPQLRTPGQNTFFQYIAGSAATVSNVGGVATPVAAVPGVSANGDHTRYSPQLYFYNGSFGLLSEYISSEQTLIRSGVERDIENTAWQVVTSYVLTGEDAGFRGVTKPQGKWGAVEVAARYGTLDVDDAAFEGTGTNRFANRHQQASEATSYGIGVNWYLTSNAKLVLNYDQTSFEGGAGTAAAPVDREDEKAVFGRIQLSF